MRRLICMLAAGLLAAGAVLTTADVAGAGATAAHRASCPRLTDNFLSSSLHGVRYYLGTPVKTFSGATVFLKPRANGTTFWNMRDCSGYILVKNRGLALTSRATSPGGNVTVETAGNSGKGFASQRWSFSCGTTCALFYFQNQKTGLWLRIRNSGPIMYQTVTTGRTKLAWERS